MGALVNFDGNQVGLQVAFDDSGLLDINGVAPALGWDEAALEALTKEFEFLPDLELEDRETMFSTRLDDAITIDAYVAPGRDRTVLWLRTRTTRPQAANVVLAITGPRRSLQVVDPEAEFAAALKAVLVRWTWAEQYDREIMPIAAALDIIPHLRDELVILRQSKLGL